MRTLLRLSLNWMVLVPALVLVLFPALASAQVYKRILPDGSVTYSDKPQEQGAQALELPPLQTYTSPQPQPPSPPAPTVPQDTESAVDTNYDVFKVATPTPDESLRANGGMISVQLVIEPPLREGHVVDIVLDGKTIASGRLSSASAKNLDRGSHTVAAVLKDAEGKVIATAPAVSFYLLRSSKLHPGRAAGRPAAR